MTTIVYLQNGQTETWADCYPTVMNGDNEITVSLAEDDSILREYDFAEVKEISFDPRNTL